MFKTGIWWCSLNIYWDTVFFLSEVHQTMGLLGGGNLRHGQCLCSPLNQVLIDTRQNSWNEAVLEKLECIVIMILIVIIKSQTHRGEKKLFYRTKAQELWNPHPHGEFLFLYFPGVLYIIARRLNSPDLDNIFSLTSSTSPFHPPFLFQHFSLHSTVVLANSTLWYCLMCPCYRKKGASTLTHTQRLWWPKVILSAIPFQGIQFSFLERILKAEVFITKGWVSSGRISDCLPWKK